MAVNELEAAAKSKSAEECAERVASQGGVYDHAKVGAFVNCCIDLAKVNGLGVFELLMASRNMMLAAEMQLARNAQRLDKERPELTEEPDAD